VTNVIDLERLLRALGRTDLDLTCHIGLSPIGSALTHTHPWKASFHWKERTGDRTEVWGFALAVPELAGVISQLSAKGMEVPMGFRVMLVELKRAEVSSPRR